MKDAIHLQQEAGRMYPNPDHVGGIPGMLYLLLDPGKFKKHIELTYAAVIASKNECNCIFFVSCLWPAVWPLPPNASRRVQVCVRWWHSGWQNIRILTCSQSYKVACIRYDHHHRPTARSFSSLVPRESWLATIVPTCRISHYLQAVVRSLYG